MTTYIEAYRHKRAALARLQSAADLLKTVKPEKRPQMQKRVNSARAEYNAACEKVANFYREQA